MLFVPYFFPILAPNAQKQSVQDLKIRYIDETIKYFDQFYKTLDHTKRIQYELIEKSRKD